MSAFSSSLLTRSNYNSARRAACIFCSSPDNSMDIDCADYFYGRPMVTGNDLAKHGGPCSCPPHWEGHVVATIPVRLLPAALGSSHEHDYHADDNGHEHLLFRPFLSCKWTALR